MFYWSDSKRVVTNIVLTSPLCCVNSYFKGLFYYINSPDAVISLCLFTGVLYVTSIIMI